MKSFLTATARALIVAGLCSAVGLHWLILQSTAWTGMVISFSQDAPLAVAIGKAFDGKHPCALCKAIQSGKETEKKSEVLPAVKKLDLLCKENRVGLFAPHHCEEHPEVVFLSRMRSEQPPVPPPRGSQFVG
jgi:hypothetical protein